MVANWYAIHSKPQNEEFLWSQLCAREVETFFPRIQVQTVNPRARKVRPYFPGYLFIHVDLSKLHATSFQWLPGANRLVTFGLEPALIPENLIRAIQKRVDEINNAGGELLDDVRKGDRVVIQEGPFKGFEAIFDAKISGNERVRVLLSLIQTRQVFLELPTGLLRKKKRT